MPADRPENESRTCLEIFQSGHAGREAIRQSRLASRDIAGVMGLDSKTLCTHPSARQKSSALRQPYHCSECQTRLAWSDSTDDRARRYGTISPKVRDAARRRGR